MENKPNDGVCTQVEFNQHLFHISGINTVVISHVTVPKLKYSLCIELSMVTLTSDLSRSDCFSCELRFELYIRPLEK